MIQIQTLGEDDKTVRTQITLTQNIKKIVEEMASDVGESLSEYLRKAALMRILVEQNQAEDRGEFIKSVIGSVKMKGHPNWSTKAKVEKWLRDLREEKNDLYS